MGLTAEQMNTTFQKSWKKVRDASMMQLLHEQLVHYFTTYGFESLGIYDKDSVYVPHSELNIPDLRSDIPIVIIKGYTKQMLKEKLQVILNSGIALSDETKNDILEVAVFCDITEADIYSIKNREVQAVLFDYFDLIPETPVEFFRYILFRTINKTLIIKNRETFEAIKTSVSTNIKAVKLIKQYQDKYGLERLAEIFYRFKPLFLALRSNSNLRPTINKIRKLAKKHHKPLAEDFLNTITAKIKNDKKIDKNVLLDELRKVNIFRKIRLAQALKYRTLQGTDSILYKIRNGKGFATDFSFKNHSVAEEILETVLTIIYESIRAKVKGQKVFIPANISYALPATEKQFTGNLPSGSSISVDKDMIFGIHWTDTSRRIDLDLSLVNINIGKIGWDSQHKNEKKTVLFSGDLTAAPEPDGASELFYIKRQEESSYILFTNYFNFSPVDPVPYKILVAKEQLEDFEENYMVNPNNILCVTSSTISVKQRMIGLVIMTMEGNIFYFNESDLGRAISSSTTEFAEAARRYLYHYCKNTLSLNKALERAGAIMVDKQEEADIDLSPENLEKDTIMNLLI